MITKCMVWDMTIQCGHVIEARQPDIVVVEKESNKVIIVVDITSLWNQRVYEKEGEKIDEYQNLKREKVWGIRQQEVCLFVCLSRLRFMAAIKLMWTCYTHSHFHKGQTPQHRELRALLFTNSVWIGFFNIPPLFATRVVRWDLWVVVLIRGDLKV